MYRGISHSRKLVRSCLCERGAACKSSGVRGAPKRKLSTATYTPVAGERIADSSTALPNISHIRTGEEREEREARDGRQRGYRGTMLTFRKRVRSASTVISVFSEWPESLGPSALRRKLHLDSRRVDVSLSLLRSVCLRLPPLIALSIHSSSHSRCDALTQQRSLNSFRGTSFFQRSKTRAHAS